MKNPFPRIGGKGLLTAAATAALCLTATAHSLTVRATATTTYIVTSGADNETGSCTANPSTPDANCQLREAIADAEDAGGPVDITFELPAEAEDTVTLDPADNGEITLNDDTVTITGNGASSTGTVINGGGTLSNTSQLFRLQDGGSLTLADLEITGYECNDDENGECSVVQLGNNHDEGGTPSITFTDDLLTGNETSVPSDEDCVDCGEGSVVNNYEGDVTATGTEFSDNFTAGQGGVIYNNAGTVTIDESEFLDNETYNASLGTDSFGSAIYNGYDLSVDQTLFDGNTGDAAVFQNQGYDAPDTPTAVIANSTFDDNVSESNWASAIDNNDGDDPMSLVNDTVANNTSSNGDSAAIEVNGDDTTDVENTIFQSNAPTNCNGDDGLPTSLGNNLDSDGTCGFAATGDLSNESADLQSALTDNGGVTDTLALLPGSPAIGAGSNTACAAALTADPAGAGGVDERGVSRPQGTTCDMGAFEDAATSSGVTITTSAPTSDDTVNITVSVTSANADAGTPEGSVTLSDPANAVLGGSATASFTIGPLTPGTYTLTATYTPTNGFLPSSATTSLTVTAAAVPVPATGSSPVLAACTAGGGIGLLGAAFLFGTWWLPRKRVLLDR